MDSITIAQWVIGLFIGFAGVLAIGKIITEKDEAKGYCDIRFRKKRKNRE